MRILLFCIDNDSKDKLKLEARNLRLMRILLFDSSFLDKNAVL
jgi:hypothetical protein